MKKKNISGGRVGSGGGGGGGVRVEVFVKNPKKIFLIWGGGGGGCEN